jgi:uncharacterized membrane protein YhaH (DUF805 family)
MLGSIKYNLAHLLDFRGRDARQTFWYFVLFVYVLNIGLSMLVAIPLYVRMVSRMIAAAQTDPEAVEQIMPSMVTDMLGPIMWLGVLSGVLYLVLLGGAFTRRLHDSGLPGWWGLIPAIFQLVSLATLPSMIDAMKEFMTITPGESPLGQMQLMQQQFGLASLAGWVPVIAVIALGVRKSAVGPNRYGEAPVRF